MTGPLEGLPNSLSKTGVSRLAEAGLLPPGLEKGTMFLRLVAGRCSSFDSIGRAILWMIFNLPKLETETEVSELLRVMVVGKLAPLTAVHRGFTTRCRPLLPLPLGELSKLQDWAKQATLDEFCTPHFAEVTAVEIWTGLTLLGLNSAAGYGRAAIKARPSLAQSRAVSAIAIAASIKRVLDDDLRLERSPAEAEKELAARFLTYTGEEVPKMQVLTVEQVLPALPPISHGGSIDAVQLVSPGTRWFLEHPDDSCLGKVPKGIKLQAKVHVAAADALPLFNLLVERRICTWVHDDDVLKVEGQKVLSGMFAVGKGSYLAGGQEIQRVIMNLIPCNAVYQHVEGGTRDLPSITQYLSMVLNGDERVKMFQSDMTSAFYLFRIPQPWFKSMCFNIAFRGDGIGLPGDGPYRPCCTVIPMGWSSAVAVMQEIADRLTVLAGLPRTHQIRRTSPLPPWLTGICEQARDQGRQWYHVYLDNFCAMEKVTDQDAPVGGRELHRALESAWDAVGVLSSAKKKLDGGDRALELGALIDGDTGTLGASPERMLRLVQSTLVVISKARLRKKWIQVIAGRWVHAMSFRRPTMCFLDKTWKYIAGQYHGERVEAFVRSELLDCVCGVLLMHTNLRAPLTQVTTASDASMIGGAVGRSDELTEAGKEFAAADMSGRASGVEIPVLVVSLFNGIGCCFRCYDLCGVTPMVAIAYEISAEGNRVTSRRWPNVKIERDVRELTTSRLSALGGTCTPLSPRSIYGVASLVWA